MTEPLKLVPAPKLDDEIREKVIRLAESIAEEARNGEVVSLAAIIKRADGSWGERFSATPNRSELIGQLIIAIVGWCVDIQQEYREIS